MSIRYLQVMSLCALALLMSSTSSAQETDFNARLSSLLHLQSDRDFDSTPSLFDPQGQWLGQAGSFANASVLYQANTQTSLYYEVLLGWNSWGRHDPNQPSPFSPAANQSVMIRHQQLHGILTRDELSLKVGFIDHADPSTLLISQPIGGIEFTHTTKQRGSRLFLGQLPENAFEGWDANENNFDQDSVIWGASAWWSLQDLHLTTAVYGVFDERYLDRTLMLHTGIIGLERRDSNLEFGAYILGQAGTRDNGNLAGERETIQSYAGRMNLAYQWGTSKAGAKLKFGGLWLSPEQGIPGDGSAKSFYWSGKSMSDSIWLTENERQDRYNNLDERWGTAYGPFTRQEAGYQLFDLAIVLDFHPTTTTLSVAQAMTLNPEYRNGHRLLGTEITALFDWRFTEDWSLSIDGFVLIPQAGGAYGYNGIDQTATDLVFGSQLALSVEL